MTPAFDVPKTWKGVLRDVLVTQRSFNLAKFIENEIALKKQIYPVQDQWFLALQLTAPQDVRIVILGQDPYHGENQAHGLAFSVTDGTPIPPSLRNIYKELHRDLALPLPRSGNLEHWATQGVLLLNTVLTVENGKPASHQKQGWEEITDVIIRHLGDRNDPVIFLLWGAHAQKKRELIAGSQHLILEAAHPSPLSAHRGFIGCGHFSKVNDALLSNNIDW